MAELPLLGVLMPEGSLWRGLSHEPQQVDMGDIGVLSHTRKGLECYLFKAERRMVFPWPNDGNILVDRHNHIRVGDPKAGKVKVTFAPA